MNVSGPRNHERRGLADAAAASTFRLARLHPGIGAPLGPHGATRLPEANEAAGEWPFDSARARADHPLHVFHDRTSTVPVRTRRHHEVDVMQACRHPRTGERLVPFRVPMDLRHLGAVGERLAVAGNAGLVGV